ncbi:MAG: cytidylate kinase-like family protein [Chloroflexi bacterium]|nr:cytidylate kinase-like family protein [Chloroflexota bacterium]
MVATYHLRMPLVAISREIGTGAAEVAEQVARALGADLVDRRIIDEIARRLQIPREEAQALDESPPRFLERLLSALAQGNTGYAEGSSGWMPPYPDDPAFDARRASLRITEEVMKEAVRTGNVVIVGRGAAYLLRDDPRVLRAFLRGSREARAAAVMKSLQLDAKAAERRVKESDVNWGAYLRDVYHVDWRDPSNYDLVLDTSRLGADGAAQVILSAVRHLR